MMEASLFLEERLLESAVVCLGCLDVMLVGMLRSPTITSVSFSGEKVRMLDGCRSGRLVGC